LLHIPHSESTLILIKSPWEKTTIWRKKKFYGVKIKIFCECYEAQMIKYSSLFPFFLSRQYTYDIVLDKLETECGTNIEWRKCLSITKFFHEFPRWGFKCKTPTNWERKFPLRKKGLKLRTGFAPRNVIRYLQSFFQLWDLKKC